MERFEHLAMVAFLILGLALVRLMINLTSLLADSSFLEQETEMLRISAERIANLRMILFSCGFFNF